MSVMITLGCLCWNTQEVTAESLEALRLEADSLRDANYRVKIVTVDNSKQGSMPLACLSDTYFSLGENRGASYGRNLIVRAAEQAHSNYVLLTDGDIEIIPGSVQAMVLHLESHPEIMCLSPDPAHFVGYRGAQTPYVAAVMSTHADALMYVCGYGLFRASVFETLRFDQSGPFGQPGWGHEDDDFFFQMYEAGFSCRYVDGWAYLHRSQRSSWAHLEAAGVDVEQTFLKRKEYLLAKWRKPHMHSGMLNMVKAQSVQFHERAH